MVEIHLFCSVSLRKIENDVYNALEASVYTANLSTCSKEIEILSGVR